MEEIPIAGSESTLTKFYWRYSHATPDYHSHDTTVEHVLDKAKAKAIQETLGFNEKCKLFHLKVGENGYIVGKPTYMGISSPMGHSTHGFHAFCEQSEKLVFMKDTWHIIISGQLPKHKIYKRLHGKYIKNIAQLKEGTNILVHKTIMHEAVEMLSNKKFPKICKFRHYQLALKDVSGDLHDFSSVEQLVKVIRDATIGKPMISKQRMDYLTSNNLAHDDAFYKARVLHQDISVRNIIILEDGTGLLVD